MLNTSILWQQAVHLSIFFLVYFTSIAYNVLSKPLATFPHNRQQSFVSGGRGTHPDVMPIIYH